MKIIHIKLRNWRNFPRVDVDVADRLFLVGPNACGKSNFLDAFRFLRDIARQGGGGLQQAVESRGGLSKIRCLSARKTPDVEIEVHLSENGGRDQAWTYAIGIKQQPRGERRPYLAYERISRGNELLCNRPDDKDRGNEAGLKETRLERVGDNVHFRAVAKYFEDILYLHLVPQLLRHPREFSGPGIPGDPFGRSFLERIAKTTKRTRDSRLNKIEQALRHAVPQLSKLHYVMDDTEGGVPHIQAVCENWRDHGAKQREREFSDGTLRLIALLWTLLEGEGMLLLEEPELSLNAGIVRRLPPLIHRVLSKRGRQLVLSTHSADLLMDRGIGPEEVLMLVPSKEGTEVVSAASVREVRELLNSGYTPADAILPRTIPSGVHQLTLDL